MIQINYSKKFIRQYSKHERNLQLEIKVKVEIFKNTKNHKSLKVHKLHGKWKNYYSFNINYKDIIMFKYIDKNSVILMALGDHSIYE